MENSQILNPFEHPCTMSQSIDDIQLPEGISREEGGEILGSGVENEELSEEGRIDDPFDPNDIRITTWQPTIDLIVKRLKNDELILSPDFQRGDVWKTTQQSRLIESLLMRIPLPAFYFDVRPDGTFVVVDGQQRLSTIRDFIIIQELQLENLEYLPHLEGCTFDELDRALRRRIEETQLLVFRLMPETPDKVRLNVFKRLNTGGEPLTSQEIRHALHQGPATKLLNELAQSDSFSAATADGVSPTRMADRELILRFLAFWLEPYDEYNRKDLDEFLHDQMQKLNDMTDEERSELRDVFDQTMWAAHEIFDDDAFRKRFDPDANRHPINKALFETWAYNLACLDQEQRAHLVEQREELKAAFIELMNGDDDFVDSISVSTDQPKKVRKRFETIEMLLQDQLE
ncbi:MAG: DUF262 domain-containing protein [Bradymonadaceae bacterium]